MTHGLCATSVIHPSPVSCRCAESTVTSNRGGFRYSAAYKADEICAHLSEFDLIIVSDYDKGTITPELMSALRQLDKMVLVDPKRIAPELYRGVFLLKPNVEETRMALKAPTDATVASCARTFHDEYGCHVLITRGGQGMSCVLSTKRRNISRRLARSTMLPARETRLLQRWVSLWRASLSCQAALDWQMLPLA